MLAGESDDADGGDLDRGEGDDDDNAGGGDLDRDEGDDADGGGGDLDRGEGDEAEVGRGDEIPVLPFVEHDRPHQDVHHDDHDAQGHRDDHLVEHQGGEDMTHSQMFQKVEYGLPAKI